MDQTKTITPASDPIGGTAQTHFGGGMHVMEWKAVATLSHKQQQSFR
ncbi:hypothetical protein E2C01_073498 [Portunus trituberculatus]|uniref:Uncharacterized protein n=1 Tax=Portunus trituberculatus TaxID=210409 RepID=A0A5B7IBV1_PORTR|nr:hypothetical protein [Portunus trituberculatus]